MSLLNFLVIRRLSCTLALPVVLLGCRAIREIQNVQSFTPGAGAVAGQVLEKQSGAPIHGARMTLLGTDSVKVANQTNYAFTDQRGMFRFGGVLVGAYRVRAEASGFAPLVSDTIFVRSGSTVSEQYRLSPR